MLTPTDLRLQSPPRRSAVKLKKLALWGLAFVGLVAVTAGGGLWYMAGQLDPDIEPGADALGVTLTDLDGKPLRLASLAGKIVLLDVWSST
jgi:cytochrome oxidase Cu insertion factor (SCO1/SenC/PrrC family)